MAFVVSFLRGVYDFFILAYKESFFLRLIEGISDFFSRLIDIADELFFKKWKRSFTKNIADWFIKNTKESYIFKKFKIIDKWFDFLEKNAISLFDSSFFVNLTSSILKQFERKMFYVFLTLTLLVASINMLLTNLFFKFLLILLTLNLLFLFLEKWGM